MTASDSTSSNTSKYYRSPGVLPDANHPENGTGQSASKYYRPPKNASSLSFSEIFRPIPPDLSPDDKKKWITNMWNVAKATGMDVEEFNRPLYSQRPPQKNGRTRNWKDATMISEELVQTSCDPEPHYMQNFSVPSLPSLPLETMSHFAGAQADRKYSTSQGLTSETPSSQVTDDTPVSDEALTQILIQFFQDWNSNNSNFDPNYENDHSTSPPYSRTSSSSPHTYHYDHTLSPQHQLEPRPQYYQYQSQQPHATRSLSFSISTPISGTFPYHQLAPTVTPPTVTSPTETETRPRLAPFAYRSPEELAELQRVKIIPGSKYR
ncbi:hypothetical protein K435DRAFT_838693 [Dendrothele bispora CBS 962.96]|uniref:Uncharacterized protein n=1 Tax=Dendrothele bispora (strain CBS 962.96) TaxID=1314807 RepID=A0A4S8M545_DENBC|nr:hypothetical protein K435DRAFT_838693 [Dendrothele bispora CBS 962.96]